MSELSDYRRMVSDPQIRNLETTIRGQREQIAKLAAENERLTKAVMSGILPRLLEPDEANELVKFVKSLRSLS